MTENLSTKTDESALIAQVLDLEERVDDVEKSLSSLYAASKAVLIAWMTQEPHFTIEASQSLTESLLGLKEAFESVSCEDLDVLTTMGEVGHWVQRQDGTCFELKFDHQVGGMRFCQPLSPDDFIDSHGPELAKKIRQQIDEREAVKQSQIDEVLRGNCETSLLEEAKAWTEMMNQPTRVDRENLTRTLREVCAGIAGSSVVDDFGFGLD